VATQFLFEAYKYFIEPLLDFGGIRMNEQGFLVEREHGNLLHYINDNYSGKPDEVPCTYPVVPLSDEHFLQIKENREWELFNPFLSIKHMTLVTLEFKRGLVTLLSDAASELDLDKQEDLIRFYYDEYGTNQYSAGFYNMENEAEPKVMYAYIGNSFIEAMWGLCVTAFNDIDRKHAEYFYDIEKAWRKAIRLINKWDKERISIIAQTKVDNQQSYGYQFMDLSDTANTKLTHLGPDYFIAPEEQDAFLFSLFGAHELLPALNGESAEPITIKERTWQFPDFASDEAILKKTKTKKKSSKSKGFNNGELDIPSPPAIIEPSPVPSTIIPEGNVEFEIVADELASEALKDDVLTPSPGVEVKEEPVLEQPAANPLPSPGQHLPLPSPSPQAVQPPPFYGDFPWQSPYPYYNQFNNQFGPGFFGFSPPPMPQNVPTDINDIDFESNERPDPFANYKKH
jgi:hypothetical protein